MIINPSLIREGFVQEDESGYILFEDNTKIFEE